MTRTSRAANLRPLLHDSAVQNAIAEVVDAYESIILEDGRGTRITDQLRLIRTMVGSPDKKAPRKTHIRLEAETLQMLGHFLNETLDFEYYVIPPNSKSPHQEYLLSDAMRVSSLRLHGVTYKSSLNSSGDSNILFSRRVETAGNTRPGRPPFGTVPGKITDMFLHKRFEQNAWVEELFIVVRPLILLSSQHTPFDRYRTFGHSGGFLCYDKYESKGIILTQEDILCHVAQTAMVVEGIPRNCVHILPLNRVSCHSSC